MLRILLEKGDCHRFSLLSFSIIRRISSPTPSTVEVIVIPEPGITIGICKTTTAVSTHAPVVNSLKIVTLGRFNMA